MPQQPTGTVTLLFSDIEGSTRLLRELGRDRYAEALELHRRLLREAFERDGGYEVDYEGDSFFVAFATAAGAVSAAAAAQHALSAAEWPGDVEVRVRMGIHTGEPLAAPPKYVGLDVHRAARIMSAAHGGQILLSQTTRDLLDDAFAVRDLGEHRLKDLAEPQRLFQLLVEGLPTELPPPRGLDERPASLPAQPTRFVGRRRELEELVAMLRRRDVRLLTLTGAGGSGKTRLGVELARAVSADFDDGVFFVDLSPVTDPALVALTIAAAVGVREQPGRDPEATLEEFLGGKRLLLLLDNFEQALEAAPLVARLLRGAPGVKSVATSRAPLRLSEEHRFPVPPLALPDPLHLPESSALSQYEAVALFIERARAVEPAFDVTSENAPAVAEICVRVDGLPLAIELAAARIDVLSPGALLKRLERRLKLLTGGSRDLPARQQTLRATIAWSCELLSADEQALFGRLSVFVGGCTIDAAEAVVDPESSLSIDALDGLDSLVEKSLLRHEQGPDRESRYSMLETIREFAATNLDETEDAEVLRRQHARWCCALAEEAEQFIQTETQKLWFDRLESELPNLRAALAWAAQAGETDLLLRLAARLGRFWESRSRFSEGREIMESVLAVTAAERTALRLPILNYAAGLAMFSGDPGRGIALEEQCLELARDLGDEDYVARAVGNLGTMYFETGDLERGERLTREGLALDERRGHRLHLAISKLNLAEILAVRGQLEEASPLIEDATDVLGDLGDLRALAGGLMLRARVLRRLGRKDEARSSLETGLRSIRDLGDRHRCMVGLIERAAVALEDGDDGLALVLSGAVEGVRDQLAVTIPYADEPVHDQTVRVLRTTLGAEEFAAGWAEGVALPLEAAVARALGDDEAPVDPAAVAASAGAGEPPRDS